MNSKFSFLIIALTLFSSCRTVIFYSNDPVITAQVNEQGDGNISAGINFSEYNTGVHVNGTVALTENMFIGGSFTKFNKASNGINLSNNIDKFSGYNFNVLGGYYKPLENNFVIELGAGFQGGYNDNRTNSLYTNITRQKIYLQPGFSQVKDFLQWGFAIRMGLLDVTKVQSNDPNYTGIKSGFDGTFLAEPGINIAAGGKIKGGIQISYSIHDFTTMKPWGYIFGGLTTDDFSLSIFLKLDINKSNSASQSSFNSSIK